MLSKQRILFGVWSKGFDLLRARIFAKDMIRVLAGSGL